MYDPGPALIIQISTVRLVPFLRLHASSTSADDAAAIKCLPTAVQIITGASHHLSSGGRLDAILRQHPTISPIQPDKDDMLDNNIIHAHAGKSITICVRLLRRFWQRHPVGDMPVPPYPYPTHNPICVNFYATMRHKHKHSCFFLWQPILNADPFIHLAHLRFYRNVF